MRQSDPLNKPNIVLFLADDHGYYETHFDRLSYLNDDRHGEDHSAKGLEEAKRLSIPNLDRLGQDGLVFNRAYTCTAMCAPSRAALYTGMGPHRNGLHPNHSSIKDGIRTLPHYLKDLGYRVVLAGKKHIRPLEGFPFEYVRDNMKKVKRILKDSTKPVCLIYASHEPHWPHRLDGPYSAEDVSVPPNMIDTPETRELIATYWNDVSAMDREIGELLDCIEASGKEENTLFIYTSDHGACLPFAKWTLYEAGVRVPFVAYWPGVITPGSTDAMISFTDILPTFVEVAGGDAPVDIDGRSITPVLFEGAPKHRELVFAASTTEGIIRGERYPIRSVRNKDYNYIVNLEPDGRFQNVFTELSKEEREPYYLLWTSWKNAGAADPDVNRRVRMYQHRPAEELYDLNADPWELNNLADDPKYAGLKHQFRQSLRDWMVQQGDGEVKALDAQGARSAVQ